MEHIVIKQAREAFMKKPPMSSSARRPWQFVPARRVPLRVLLLPYGPRHGVNGHDMVIGEHNDRGAARSSRNSFSQFSWKPLQSPAPRTLVGRCAMLPGSHAFTSSSCRVINVGPTRLRRLQAAGNAVDARIFAEHGPRLLEVERNPGLDALTAKV